MKILCLYFFFALLFWVRCEDKCTGGPLSAGANECFEAIEHGLPACEDWRECYPSFCQAVQTMTDCLEKESSACRHHKALKAMHGNLCVDDVARETFTSLACQEIFLHVFLCLLEEGQPSCNRYETSLAQCLSEYRSENQPRCDEAHGVLRKVLQRLGDDLCYPARAAVSNGDVSPGLSLALLFAVFYQSIPGFIDLPISSIFSYLDVSILFAHLR